MANIAKFVGLSRATNDKQAPPALSNRGTLPICQTKTEFLVAHKQKSVVAFDQNSMAPINNGMAAGSPPMLTLPRAVTTEQRRVSIQEEAIRMDF
jgi:hypothetical protein